MSNTTVRVKGTTVEFSIAALYQLAADSGESLLRDIAEQAAKRIGIKVSFENMSPKQKNKVLAVLQKEHTPSRSFEIGMDGGPDEEEQEVTVTITAPSYLIGIKAYLDLTTTEKLSSLEASFMPVPHKNMVRAVITC